MAGKGNKSATSMNESFKTEMGEMVRVRGELEAAAGKREQEPETGIVI